MASLVDFHGLQVVSPPPSGTGGLAIQDDFIKLATWSPKSLWNQTANPGASDDDSLDFYPGSQWLRTDTTPAQLFVCRSSATGAAVWVSVAALSSLYVQSRGMNLVTNGLGSLLDNTNFNELTFDPVDVYAGAGSFLYATATVLELFSGELIPVDLSRTYLLSLWAKCGNLDGSHYNAVNIQLFGVAEYDIDWINILDGNCLKYAGAVDTTLAVALNPGDTTMTLTSATGWSTNVLGYTRNMAWYPYTNSKGYTYPDYTYTQHTTVGYSDFETNGMWATTGISGTTVTLRAPWPGPSLAAGTKVRNATAGDTFKYIAADQVAVPNSWTNYAGSIGGVAPQGSVTPVHGFWPATAYVKVLLLLNYTGTGTSPVNYVRVCGLNLSDIILDQVAYPPTLVPSAPTSGALVFGRNIANRPLLGMRGPATRSPLVLQPHAATRSRHRRCAEFPCPSGSGSSSREANTTSQPSGGTPPAISAWWTISADAFNLCNAARPGTGTRR